MSRPNTFEATRVANGDEPNDVLSHIKFRYVIHWYSIWLLLTYCTWLYCTSTTFNGKKFFCLLIFLWGCWMNEKGESFDVGSNQGKQGIWKRNVNLALFFQHHESSPQIVVFQNEDEPDDSIWCPDWLVVVHLHFQSRREKGRKQLGYMKRKMSKVMAKRKNEKRKRFNREERLPKMQTYFMCQTTEKGQNYRIVKHRKLFNQKRKRKNRDFSTCPAPQSSSSTLHSDFSQSFAIHDRSRRLVTSPALRIENNPLSARGQSRDSPFWVLIINVIHEHQNIYANGLLISCRKKKICRERKEKPRRKKKPKINT